ATDSLTRATRLREGGCSCSLPFLSFWAALTARITAVVIVSWDSSCGEYRIRWARTDGGNDNEDLSPRGCHGWLRRVDGLRPRPQRVSRSHRIVYDPSESHRNPRDARVRWPSPDVWGPSHEQFPAVYRRHWSGQRGRLQDY